MIVDLPDPNFVRQHSKVVPDTELPRRKGRKPDRRRRHPSLKGLIGPAYHTKYMRIYRLKNWPHWRKNKQHPELHGLPLAEYKKAYKKLNR